MSSFLRTMMGFSKGPLHPPEEPPVFDDNDFSMGTELDVHELDSVKMKAEPVQKHSMKHGGDVGLQTRPDKVWSGVFNPSKNIRMHDIGAGYFDSVPHDGTSTPKTVWEQILSSKQASDPQQTKH